MLTTLENPHTVKSRQYREEHRERMNAYWRDYRARVKAETLEHYGAACVCVCCGNAYELHLTLDHVKGGGTAERKARAGAPSWRIARQEGFPDRFQVMCWNCNWAKHYGGECRCQEDESGC